MKLKLKDISKIIIYRLKKILWVLGLHAFLLILILIILSFILGSFVFYKYVFLAERKKPDTIINVLKFDVKTYQETLNRLQARAQGDFFNEE